MISPVTKKINESLYVHCGMLIEFTSGTHWRVSFQSGPAVAAPTLERAFAVAEKRATSNRFDLTPTDEQRNASEQSGAIVWGGVTAAALHAVAGDFGRLRHRVLATICPSMLGISPEKASTDAVFVGFDDIRQRDLVLVVKDEGEATFESVWRSPLNDKINLFASLSFLPWAFPWVFVPGEGISDSRLYCRDGTYCFVSVEDLVEEAEKGAQPETSVIIRLHPEYLLVEGSQPQLIKWIHANLVSENYGHIAEKFLKQALLLPEQKNIDGLLRSLNLGAEYVRFF